MPNHRKIVSAALCFLLTAAVMAPSTVLSAAPQQSDRPLYKNASAPIEERVSDLVKRMTLTEKLGQLCSPLGWPMYQKTATGVIPSDLFRQRMDTMPLGSLWGVLRADPWTQKTLETGLNPRLGAEALNALQRYAVEKTRLGIPILIAEECPHGHMAIGTTVYPTALGQASTWNEELLEQMGSAIGLEARAQGAQIGYGPVMDIAREPRWSRMEETFGEDPVLTGILGTAVMKGMQGKDLADGKHVVSTLKHFAAYGIPEGGLNGEQANIGMRRLLSEYVPQFKRAVEAGAGTLMTSYNSIDGVPCTANRYLFTDLLREQWGFKGFVYSDLQSIEGIRTHHCAADYAEAGALSLKAGVDMDLEGNVYGKHLKEALQKGLITEADIDRAVRNVLRMKFRLGLFEHPYVDPKSAVQEVHSTKNIALAREVARQGVVLLKNNGLLPLDRKALKRIAVIGPNADNIYNQLGDYTAPQERAKICTVLDGVKQSAPDAEVVYVKGCAIRDTSDSHIAEAVKAAGESDVVILVVGGSSARDFKTKYISTGAATVESGKKILSDMECGEGYDRADLHLMGDQEKLLHAVAAAGKPVVTVYIEGRPLDMTDACRLTDAVCTAWYPGEQGGAAIADVMFGDYNPAGRLPVSIPRNVGQLPVYYSKRPAHDYVDSPQTPLFPFGYGLSYTKFEYSDLRLSASDEPGVYQTVSCTVTNSGEREGDEVVQLYVCDVSGSVSTPWKLLKGFRRISLKKGESRQVTFSLRFDDLALYNMEMKQVVEPGVFNVMVGASSDDLRLKGSFEVK